MGLIDDLSRFLEDRLEEFWQANPHLEIQALEEQIAEQEVQIRELLTQLNAELQKVEQEIVTTAEEVRLWHQRVDKARSAGRLDLLEPAVERENFLLQQGNQLWSRMQTTKQKIQQTEVLQQQIQQRRRELQAKAAEVSARRSAAQPPTDSGRYTPPPKEADPLEAKFRRWEMDEEIQNMKRQMGRS